MCVYDILDLMDGGAFVTLANEGGDILFYGESSSVDERYRMATVLQLFRGECEDIILTIDG